MNNVFFLGPSGTFTHEAAKAYFGSDANLEFEPCSTPPDVIRNLIKSDDCFGVVPIENSIHGEVIPTLDALLFEFNGIYVVGEISIQITFDFFTLSPISKPVTVISHPHALAQCRKYIANIGLSERTSNSTADACRLVSESGDITLGAIASPSAGILYNLHLYARAVEDFKGAYTRFLVLSKKLNISKDSNKTMLAVLPNNTSVGVLAELTSVFANRNINIFSIHSRPTKSAVGQYVFLLSIEGNAIHGKTSEAITILLQKGYNVKLFGSYPFLGGESPKAPYTTVPGLLDIDAFNKICEENTL